MNLSAQQNRGNENQRRYIRFESVFPVDYAVYQQGQEPVRWFQGYTCNVSCVGICLETVSLEDFVRTGLTQENFLVRLRIHSSLMRAPVKALAKLCWHQECAAEDCEKHLLGLEFIHIAPKDAARMERHANWKRFSFTGAVAVALIFLASFVWTMFQSHELRSKNERLVEEVVRIQQKETENTRLLSDVRDRKENLSREISSETADADIKKDMENYYQDLVVKENRILDRLKLIGWEKSGLQDKVLEKMRLWLRNHQSSSTGLVLSFEGKVGIIQNWAFTYDQALAADVFLMFNDLEGARMILDFFERKARSPFKGFANAYYYDSGDVTETVIHTGPNIWIGLAALQYMHQTGDFSYMPLARKITDWLIRVQDKDPDGGLNGGPGVTWFATEHNLDAYALFDMMYRISDKQKYLDAREKVFNWLNLHAMEPHSKEYKSPPMNRGLGDSTIATDTYAWALAAIGPWRLAQSGMDPEQIMNFAEENCAVKVNYERPSGIFVEAEGFDFSKSTHLPRGGLISPEWTSQMVVSFDILSDYFKEKGDTIKQGYYREKAEKYLGELNKLIISSPSVMGRGEGCLPYATLPDADTGHGWLTPHGNNTCSIAGTAYTIMAVKGFNPLMLQDAEKTDGGE